MAWSTRQLAELAGTSLRTVRHYHEVGLLPEPERSSNGYKKYGVAHLVRLLRIKRLTDLGFSLGQIAEMGDADEHPHAALRTLDAELAATIERLQRARAELAVILRHSAPTDLPPDLASAVTASGASENDRRFMVVLSRVMTASAIDAYAEAMRNTGFLPSSADFDRLPADADERTRAALAARLLPEVLELYADYPALANAASALDPERTAQAIGTAVTELYNPAQIDVMRRLGEAYHRARTGTDADPA
ncbi:helix-turn-helix domain-containing protein [Nocardia puris]|uniref:DNA-binding transcriptional MerR regulator n=1 Tax=Nocardia puris TaxID=208602 RepID=A0A366DV70_9NOCA|nr:MerR family transcriptional regulator [Nocardia puris]RBO93967.1 DNA-binding transcriptional MerR regulator [Nocardia puris]